MTLNFLAANVAVCVLMLTLPAQAQEVSEPRAPSVSLPALLLDAVAPSATEAHEGKVSYYGNQFGGRRTSSGERFEPNALTMAHRTLPFGTMVRVTNLQNNQSIVVRVNDRGPHIGGRVGDVSPAAARVLMMLRAGVVRARLEVLNMAAELK
jgi:rare lipoprotein A